LFCNKVISDLKYFTSVYKSETRLDVDRVRHNLELKTHKAVVEESFDRSISYCIRPFQQTGRINKVANNKKLMLCSCQCYDVKFNKLV